MDPNQVNKQRVISEIITLLSESVPLSQAHPATMGGAGLEIDRWRALHIPAERCWLIEQHAAKARVLRRAYPEAHHVHALADFPAAFIKARGEHAGLDLFHLDLCGNVEPSIRDLTGVLPLLLNGPGRILAVTMSDQRGSRALNEPKLAHRMCARVFGAQWNELWQNLLDVHSQGENVRDRSHVDPEKSALREANAMLYLLLAFSAVRKEGSRYEARTQRFPLMHFLRYREKGERRYLKLIEQGSLLMVPEHIQRYVYWSDASGFRMRTFLFRLKTYTEPVPMSVGAAHMAKVILKAPYSIVNGKEIANMWHQLERGASRLPKRTPADETHQRSTDTSEDPMPASDQPTSPLDAQAIIAGIKERFSPFLGAMNEGMRADFDTLCKLAQSSSASDQIMSAVGQTIAAAERLKQVCGITFVAGATATPPTPTPPASGRKAREKKSALAPAAPAKPPRKPSPSKAAGMTLGATQLDLRSVDDLRLSLLRAKHTGSEAYEQMRDRLIIQYTTETAPLAKTRISGLLANTGGPHRGGFIARHLSVRDKPEQETLLQELSTLYGTPIKTLRAEAAAGKKRMKS